MAQRTIPIAIKNISLFERTMPLACPRSTEASIVHAFQTLGTYGPGNLPLQRAAVKEIPFIGSPIGRPYSSGDDRGVRRPTSQTNDGTRGRRRWPTLSMWPLAPHGQHNDQHQYQDHKSGPRELFQSGYCFASLASAPNGASCLSHASSAPLMNRTANEDTCSLFVPYSRRG
jgi:hypothetical protein